MATREDDWMWYSAYVYCRWEEDGQEHGDNETDHDWAWRVVFWTDSQYLDMEDCIFDSILEFLDWYSIWPETVDLDSMREIMYGHDEDPSIFGLFEGVNTTYRLLE